MLTLQEREELYIPWLEEYIEGAVTEAESSGGLCFFLGCRLDNIGGNSVRAFYDVESYRLSLCLFDNLRKWEGRLYPQPAYIGKAYGSIPERIDAARKILSFLKLWA